jgi:hypothetical protein
METHKCARCKEPILGDENRHRDPAQWEFVGGGTAKTQYIHQDCDKAAKQDDLFDTDSEPDIGDEGRHEGRRYVVTDRANLIEGLFGNWTVVGVWLDPPHTA